MRFRNHSQHLTLSKSSNADSTSSLGNWDVPNFLFSYLMVGVFPVLFFSWKFFKKTKWMKPEDVVLRTKEVDDIEEYTRNYVEPKAKSRFHGILDKIFG